jgi:predicted secreted protein
MHLRHDPSYWLLLFVLLALIYRPYAACAITRTITDADKEGSVQLETGDILEVHLKSNPTTGYMWYVHAKSTHLLKLIGQSETQAPEPGVGRPVIQIFKFQPRGPGDGLLLFHYVRSWEKPTPDEEQFDLHLSIK